MSLNAKLEKRRRHTELRGLEEKVKLLTRVVEIMLEHSPERVNERVNALLEGKDG